MRSKFLLLILCMFSLDASAQKVTFRLEAPLAVHADEHFRIEFRLDGASGSEFSPPSFTGCEVLAGPTSTSGSNIMIVNGRQSGGPFDIYTYVIQPTGNTKKITITPASVMVGGKKYSSQVVQINVSAASTGANGASTHTPSSGKLAADDVILRMSLSRTNLYKGEALVATLKLYMRVGVSGLQNPKYPTFNGFWVQELDVNNSQPQRESLGDKVYEVQPIRQWLLYPQRSGVLEVEQSSFTAFLQVVTRASGASLFDNFMGGGSTVENIERSLIAPPIKVQVKELPSKGAPITGSAAVGQFSLSSEITADEITANSAASLKVTLSGTGDFPIIEAPDFKLPSEFEQYETKSTEQLSATVNGSTGSRTWEFPFIARSEGDYTMPSVEVHYFDPKSGVYKTLSTPTYKLKVLRDPTGGRNSTTVLSGINKEDLKVVGSDIRHIKRGNLALNSTSSGLLFSTTYFAFIAALMALFVTALILLKKQIRSRADVAGRKNRKASKVALSRLRRAKTLMEADDRRAFFEETLRGLWGYLGDKFAIPQSELTKQNVMEQFIDHGVAIDTAQEFIAIIEDCEMAQYSPQGEVDVRQVYDRALSVIDKIE